jgi:hypothetical protein
MLSSDCRDQSSIPGDFKQDSWWTKQHWGRFLYKYFGFPLPLIIPWLLHICISLISHFLSVNTQHTCTVLTPSNIGSFYKYQCLTLLHVLTIMATGCSLVYHCPLKRVIFLTKQHIIIPLGCNHTKADQGTSLSVSQSANRFK